MVNPANLFRVSFFHSVKDRRRSRWISPDKKNGRAAGDILRRKTMPTEMSASFRLQPNTMRDFYEHRRRRCYSFRSTTEREVAGWIAEKFRRAVSPHEIPLCAAINVVFCRDLLRFGVSFPSLRRILRIFYCRIYFPACTCRGCDKLNRRYL